MSVQATAATETRSYHHGNLAASILERAAEIIDEEGIEALTLRGIARDLGVSHGAPNRHFKNKATLLCALATSGWLSVRDATLDAADATGSSNAHIRLNAMGQGYLRWAFANRSLYRALYHPDVNRYASTELKEAIDQFSQTVRDAVEETQKEGRAQDVPLNVLTVFTNAVPTGAALMLTDPLLHHDVESEGELDRLIEQIIELVVPVAGINK